MGGGRAISSEYEGKTREELVVDLEESRAEIARLKSIIADQRKIFDVSKASPGKRDREVRPERAGTLKGELLEKQRALEALNSKEIRAEEPGARNEELLNAREALRKAEEEFRTIFQRAGVAIFMADAGTGEIIDCNAKAEELIGRPRGEIVGFPQTRLHPAGMAAERRDAFERNALRDSVANFETVVQHRDGRVIPVIINAARITVDGRAVMLGLFLDITERKRAEEALRESEEKFRTLADTAKGFIAVHLGGRFLYVNDHATVLTGYSKDELMEMEYWEIFAPGDRELIKRLAKERLDGDVVPSNYEARIFTKDGKTKWVNLSAGLFNYGGKPSIIATLFDITNAKNAEEALSKNLAELVKAQEIGRLGSWSYDCDSERFDVSDEVYRIFGFAPGSVEPTRDLFFKLIHPDNLERLRKRFVSPAPEGRRGGLDFRVIWPDGSVHYLYAYVDSVVRAPDGRVKTMSGIAQDITERKRAEEALVREKYILAKSQEVAHMGNWALDVEAGEFTGSDENDRIHGYEPCEFKPTPEWVLSRVHPEDRAVVADLMEASAREGKRGSIDYRIIRPDGSVRNVSAIVDRAVRDKAGKVKRLYGITQDITERKHMEDAVRRSERYLSSIFDGIQEGISVLDSDMNIVMVNRTMVEWYSHMLPLVGKKCYQAYQGRTGSCEDCPSLRAMREKTMQMSVVPYTNDTGVAGWMELYSSPLLDDEGNVTGVIEHVRDITERKRAEREINEARMQAELYLDLMGHDINNMHQIALGYLELARDMPQGGEQAEFLDKPVEVLQRSAQLIQNVRKLQKLRDGVFKTELVDVCRVITDVQREFGAVPGKSVALNFNGRERCFVLANELLHDVFANLVSNAIKHTGDRAEIAIDLDVINDNGSRCCRVFVEDDGPGIPDAFKAKIFDRTLRGTNNAKGMGLGLYLVKSLVDSYGGRVWVEDRILGDHTKGARFAVMLPAV